ncbi:MAG: alpha/beta fold hydrolase [Crocinitomicaceae bacterium]|nr:alpha/beta fold hydrolase [Crocinitomicaceae bacterium]
MKRLLLLTMLTAIICSCSFNSLFLYPYPLTSESTFKGYDEQKGDTLTLRFSHVGDPTFTHSDMRPVTFDYTIKNHFFTNSNNDSINGWMITSKGSNKGVTLFFLHGNTGNISYNYPLTTPFVERGYSVFIIDYSEFGFSHGKATRKNVILDANAGLNYLLSMDEIKNDKIIIYGQSLGGHLATVIAKQNEHKIDGLVIEGAFSSHHDIAAEEAGFLGRIFVKERYSAKDSIGLIQKPVLVIHSKEDETIPIEHGEALYAAATEPKDFYVIDQKHILGPLYYADSIVARIENLIK